jgi:hypothetical protein
MDYGKSYCKTIKSINAELLRMTKTKNLLMDEKKKTEEKLYYWMKKNGVEELDGIKIEKIKPKEKVLMVRKKKKEKEDDAIRILMETGIPDPVEVYKKIQISSKPVKVSENA